MRKMAEWKGLSDDASVPPRVRVRIWQSYDGRCACGCGTKIFGKPWQLDHKVALCNGGEHRESNLRPILVEHHKSKTRDDLAEKARAYRKQRGQAGVKYNRPSFQTNRDGPFRKRIDGSVVRR